MSMLNHYCQRQQPRAPIIHWMNIDIEQSWRSKSADFIPSVKKGYDEKVFGTERLAVFWATQQDYVVLRAPPPVAWLQHLEERGIDLPTIIVLEDPVAYIDAEQVFQLIDDHHRQVVLNPYVVTDDVVKLSRTAGLKLLGSDASLVMQLNNKVAQRNLLEEAKIPVPEGRLFNSSSELLDYVQSNTIENVIGHVIKLPYGASGQGLFIIESEQSVINLCHLLQRLSTNIEGVVVFERWYETTHNLNYNLNLIEGKASKPQLRDLKEQILEDGVFRGFIYPAEVSPTVKSSLEDYASTISKQLLELGCRGVVSIDAIVTAGGEIFPAVDINLRFSLSTYFQQCLLFSDRHIKLLYVDAHLPQSVEYIISNIKSVSDGLPGTITIASISAIGVGGKRRVFALLDADCKESLYETEQGWVAVLKKCVGKREKAV